MWFRRRGYRKPERFPPFDVTGELRFIREPYAKGLTVILPNGDSYKLSWDTARIWLSRLGDPDPDRVLGYLWNFYTVVYSTVDYSYWWLPREELINGTTYRNVSPAVFLAYR